MNKKEQKIPMPWGHVAAQCYGDEKDQCVLVIHGIQDNSGSFERLIKLLPSSFYYVCIDLPSHGCSSHLPGNLPIYTLDYLIVYKMIMDYFDRKKYIILGHSYGAQLGLQFTHIYPEYVIKLIMLDAVNLFPYTIGAYKKNMIYHHEQYMKYLKNQSTPETQPSYTYDEALNKLTNSRRYGLLNPEAAKPILKRSLEQLPNGKYRFTVDPRLKVFMNPTFNMHMLGQLLKEYPITCPHMLILAKDVGQWNYFRGVLKIMKKNKKCIVKIVEGDHDVHNNEPENVAPHVSQFLVSHNSKL